MPKTDPHIARLQSAGFKTFVVEGSGEFPWDMLRYDDAFPVSFEDWLAIHVRYDDHPHLGGVEGSARPDFLGRRRVRLSTTARAFSVPTVGRWESFNWRVVEIDGHEQVRQPAQAARANG